ncbi:MAG: bifunctional UDP-N-acetylglucosamine diphosphorylase/glucosamine-1-phosphate N-acetyltransferase GlmU [Candidatus Accumulibacter sp.]|jgi:bifunctional UDP-N-acetylglucosamine pyrophosphorylase/glucosamine-1-phosphate N-acetyltransferase|nr:bifunctional UDP-N-acetylglucosamine diphosphorylase/glucosamine-1-phosphate N-acetyltransferase GlmU [Accumulibacter sp.]
MRSSQTRQEAETRPESGLDIVILAAGQGKRMNSTLLKVLHPLAGKPLVSYVIRVARSLSPRRLCIVHGHGGEAVRGAVDASDLRWALQETQSGTGHAVLQAMPHLPGDGTALVLYGDVPLIRTKTLERLVETARGALAVLTVDLFDPTGYGRILRDASGRILRIVEQKDATDEERRIREVNTGIMAIPEARLGAWLARLSNDNAQKEYYLTDIVAQAVDEDLPVCAVRPEYEWEALGVNSPGELAALERVVQRATAEELMERGVRLADPARIDVRGDLVCGRGVFIDVNNVFEGAVELGDDVEIGPNCFVRDAKIGAGSRIAAFTHIDGARVGPEARIGPYARLRPGTELNENVHIGNFVEIKKSRIDSDSKASHLAYVGDALVGRRVNIGAGTITCNYDGANKYQTVIEDDAFIGSDSQLVAPVRVGKGATLGAGTTLTRDVPPDALAVTRPKTLLISAWKRPSKKET